MSEKTEMGGFWDSRQNRGWEKTDVQVHKKISQKNLAENLGM